MSDTAHHDPAVWRSRILDAVDFVQSDGIRAWDTIEPLAGMFFPRVKAEIEAELRLRGCDPLTGAPLPPTTRRQKAGANERTS